MDEFQPLSGNGTIGAGEAAPEDGAHILGVEIDGPEIIPPGTTTATATAPDSLLTQEQFFFAFASVFTVAGRVTSLQSLPVDPADAGARAASDAIYDTCLEVPWLRSLLSPGNVYLQRTLVVGMFAVPKYLAVRAELAARAAAARAAKAEAAKTADDGRQ